MDKLLEKIWVVDESALSKKLTDALKEGKAVIHDGVAYWASGSGHKGVIQHLPFKETFARSVEEAIKTAQMTTVIATAASTCIILGALIAQTNYLAGKLDKIQSTADAIAQDVHSQNIIYYLDKITNYIGKIEFARTLLSDRSLGNEIKDIAYPLIANLATNRTHILLLIENIINFNINQNNLTKNHFELIINFTQKVMEIIPLCIHTEYLLSCRIGKPRLAEQILTDGAIKYKITINKYQEILKKLNQSFVCGEIGKYSETFKKVRPDAKKLFNSPESESLLSLPYGRMAISEV